MSHRFSSAFEAVIDSEIDCLYPSRAFFKPDYGYAEGTTWLIMEFCDSGTLQVLQRLAFSCLPQLRGWVGSFPDRTACTLFLIG